MGRIGKRLLEIPKGVEVKIIDGTIQVKGPKGLLTQEYNHAIKIEVKDNKVATTVQSTDQKAAALQGLYNSLIKNMIIGVTQGYEKKLEMVGVG